MDSVEGEAFLKLTFLTFVNLKIGVSVHFLKVVLKKYKTHAMKDSKKQSVIGTIIKTTCETIVLNTSIQPVFSYIMPPNIK